MSGLGDFGQSRRKRKGDGDGGQSQSGPQPEFSSGLDWMAFAQVALSYLGQLPFMRRSDRLRAEVRRVHEHLQEAAYEIGVAPLEMTQRMTILELLGAIVGHWLDVGTGRAAGEADGIKPRLRSDADARTEAAAKAKPIDGEYREL